MSTSKLAETPLSNFANSSAKQICILLYEYADTNKGKRVLQRTQHTSRMRQAQAREEDTGNTEFAEAHAHSQVYEQGTQIRTK